ncbi:MAG TPA: diguanylate cyclase [Polyangiaceae bacterium]|nr:diguanylate cyclase [Polyangiaceae bacterium]
MPAKPGQPLSLAALQVVKASLGENTALVTLAALAESDPGFAVRVLALVNSAAFGLGRKITDVRQGAALLGVRGLRNIGLQLALTDMIPRGEAGELLLSACLRRATAARLLAQATSRGDLDGHFTAGLFLDLGMLSRMRSDAQGTLELVRLPAQHRVIFERSLGQEDHAELGCALASEFHLSADVVEAIAAHHDARPPEAPLARLAWVAERVAARFEGGDLAQLDAEAFAGMELLGLARDKAEHVVKEMPALAAAAARGLGCEAIDEKALGATLVDVNRGLAALNQSYEVMVRRLEALITEKEDLAKSLAEANARLEALAMSDPLTGLANRRAVEAALSRDLARADREKKWISVVALDVDHFKKVNDTHGHAGGDQVLVAMGELLRTALRAGDLAGRIGGEEFLTILPDTDPAGAMVAAERLRARIAAQRVVLPSGELSFTSSLGVASMQGPGCLRAATTLMERADGALYEAKRAGRNRVVRAA